MSPFDRIVEKAIQDAMQRGEFDHLAGQGKPIDLEAYFETPEDLRLAYSTLKNAGVLPREAELLNEIAELTQALAACQDTDKQKELNKQIEHRRLEFRLRMEQIRSARKKGVN